MSCRGEVDVKNDVIDAAAAASVAALQGDASIVVPEDTTVVFALLKRAESEPGGISVLNRQRI